MRTRRTSSLLKPPIPGAVAAKITVREPFDSFAAISGRLGCNVNAANPAHEHRSTLRPDALEGLPFRGVVAFAGKDLQIVVSRFDFDFAEFPVRGWVGRSLPPAISTPQLFV